MEANISLASDRQLAVNFAVGCPERVWALLAASVSPYGPDATIDLRAAEVLTLLVAGRPGRAADMYLDVWCPLRTSPAVDERIRGMVHDNIAMLTQIPNGRMEPARHWTGERVRELQERGFHVDSA